MIAEEIVEKSSDGCNYLSMVLNATSDWSGDVNAREFVNILVTENDFLLPEKFDRREPERFVFDPEELSKFIEIWTSDVIGLITKRKKPYLAWMMVDIWYREAKVFNEIMSGFDERYFKKADNVTKLLSCAKRLYNWGAIAHGYVCHEEDFEIKNCFDVITEDFRGSPTATGGVRLDEGLPGIYWANFFGPVYVELFGRKKFNTAPAYYKEELPDGGFLILTSESPLDYGQKKVRKLEEKIIDHLGRKAFFEKAHPRKICRVPKFTFEQKALGHPIEVIEYDSVSDVIPEPQRFIQEARQLSEKFVKRVSKEIDYSPESLQRVDDFILKKSYRRPKPWDNEKWRVIIQEITAYYGEVLRRNLQGKWIVRECDKGISHPVVVFVIKGQKQDEHPFTRVIKLWCERERADGLAVRYHLFSSGEWGKLESFISSHLLKCER